MSAAPHKGIVNVAEINPYAPRPYTFTEAALCLRDAIRAAGYASEVQVNRVDLNQRCLVLGALPPHFAAVEQLDRRKAIIVNFEQLAARPLVTGDAYVPWLRQWLVADYHQRNVDWLRGVNGEQQRVAELPLVPSASVAFRPELADQAKAVDVLFFGTPNERRDHLLQQLREEGLTVETVAGAFADELAPAIHRARLVLHVHFYPTGLFPVVRMLQPVMQGVPIVCEDAVFSPASDWARSGIAFAPYEELAATCRRLLGDADACALQVQRNRAFAASIDFATPFERLLAQLPQVAPVRQAPPPGVAPPAPIAPPVAAASKPSPVPHAPATGAPPSATEALAEDEQRPLSDEEIEAILAREAEDLPPEAGAPAPPLKLVERQPGQGRFGVWIVVLLLVFSFYTIWLSMRR